MTDNQHIDTKLQQHLQHLLSNLQLEDAPAGGAVVVYQAGHCIAQASVGQAQAKVAWSPDTLALNFSTGKGVLATLVHVLVSQQLLAYDEPIASYWPAFAAQDKGELTLRQVMSHQAHLFSIQSLKADSEALLNWAQMLDMVAAMPITAPDHAERYGSAYSALVYGWVLGGVIEAVTELSLAEALRAYLTEPLGIADSCYFGVPAATIDQVATLAKNFAQASEGRSPLGNRGHKPTIKADSDRTLQTYASLPSYECWQRAATALHIGAANGQPHLPVLDTARINRLYFNTSKLNLKNYKAALIPIGKEALNYYSSDTLQAVIPAANGVASAQALAVIYAMLANKGRWQGRTLIDHHTFEALATPLVAGVDAVMPASMHWRLGYHRRFDVCQHQADGQATTQGFGHMGYNGSVAWCDPARQLSFAFVHNFDTTMLNDIRQFALTEAVLSSMDARL